MSRLLQIWPTFAFVYWTNVAHGTPIFQGFSVLKSFEVNLKPFQFKPISFFREKWSPFGRFGTRKGIQKRDLVGVSDEKIPPPVPPAPIFEHIEEVNLERRKDNIQAPASEYRPDLTPVKPLLSNLIRIPLTENFKPQTQGLYTSIRRNPSTNNYIEKSAPLLEEIYGELPPRQVGPIPARPVNFIPAPINPILVQPLASKEVIPLLVPPSSPPIVVTPNIISEIPPTEGPLVRGSKLALYLGNVFVQLVSEFLTNARLQFRQFSNQQAPSPVPLQ